MEGTDRNTRPAGRTVTLLVFGNTAVELELAALDEARLFFGSEARLEVVRDWAAAPDVDMWNFMEKYRERAAGKTYSASVTVRTIEAGE